MMKKVFFLCTALWCCIALNGASISDTTLNYGLHNHSGIMSFETDFHTVTGNEMSGITFQHKSEKRIAKKFAKVVALAGEAINDDKLSLRALHLGITSVILILLGFLSVIVLSTGIMLFLFAILSTITGISAMAKAKKILKNKEANPRSRRRATFGLTLGSIGLCLSVLPYIILIVALLALRQ